MKKGIYILLSAILLSLMIVGCSSSEIKQKESTNQDTTKETEAVSKEKETVAINETVKEERTSSSAVSSSSYTAASSSTNKTSTSFTNKYGTPTTKCAKAGCNNYIASSGDTCYCPTHSNRCLECNKYIDGDAMYCLDCIAKAASDVLKDESASSSSGSSNYSSGSSSYSSGNNNSSGYGYDPSTLNNN